MSLEGGQDMRGLGKVYTVKEITDLVSPVFHKHNVKSAILFGSYAKGTMDKSSDIDLVVDTEQRGFQFTAILADLFDIFGYGNVDLYAWYEFDKGDQLLSEIKRTGLVIYREGEE